MDKGNWIPIDKRAVVHLPTDRTYSIVEALYSLTVDIDNGKVASVRAYAGLWGWDIARVHRFIKPLLKGKDYINRGTKVKQKRNKSGTPIRIVFNNLEYHQETKVKQKCNKSETHSIYPNPEPNPKDKKRSTHTFSPPSIEEVISYCKERDNQVDAQRWHDHYEAVGWMVGKKKMVSWKAAVRTWENSELGGNNGSNSNHSRRGTGKPYEDTQGTGHIGYPETYPVDYEETSI